MSLTQGYESIRKSGGGYPVTRDQWFNVLAHPGLEERPS